MLRCSLLQDRSWQLRKLLKCNIEFDLWRRKCVTAKPTVVTWFMHKVATVMPDPWSSAFGLVAGKFSISIYQCQYFGTWCAWNDAAYALTDSRIVLENHSLQTDWYHLCATLMTRSDQNHVSVPFDFSHWQLNGDVAIAICEYTLLQYDLFTNYFVQSCYYLELKHKINKHVKHKLKTRNKANIEQCHTAIYACVFSTYKTTSAN